MPSDATPVRLLIKPVIGQASALAARVVKELPTHDGLQRATRMVEGAALKAERIAAEMQRPWSPHRLPVMFLTAAMVGLLTFLYWQFFNVSTLSLALPDRDAMLIRENIAADTRVNVTIIDVPGSREAAALLEKGEVDLGFIQGGVPIPSRLLRLETPTRELVLFFVRDRITGPSQVKKVLTSVEGEGSHSVAQAFFGAWSVPVVFVHGWKDVTADEHSVVPDDIDAVFVVKDPGDEKALLGAERLVKAGFQLTSPALGARAGRFDYLTPYVLPRGHVRADPPLPASPVETYSVSTFLVARQGLTPRLLTQAANVIEAHPRTISEGSFRLSSGEASELFQGVDAFFSIIVNIGLAFLALLGLDVFAYRKQFHELNSLVSIVSMLQSNKDVLGVPVGVRGENLLYLSLCSDMLSLISAISGYYTQENSSLLFNNLSEVVHQRCDSLKINIQLKLLHAMVGQ
ncbi:MAG: hypothetical protein Q8N23_05755 [Archangium sp.]|nr:hypothetical protein [Archangium sp.]MDP3152154.1 hypothetical protein [Archangium sp.]MDP3574964.1 hypothetical protein [Archangium sp.]